MKTPLPSWTVCACALLLVSAAALAGPKAVSLEERIRLINPAKAGELVLRATYSSISVCYGAGDAVKGLRLAYRREGKGAWRDALAPAYFSDTRDCRGSIVNLAENTPYEVRVSDGDRVLAAGRVRTWRSDVPIARTVEVGPATKWPLVIDAQGSPDGWIRYVAKGGAKFTRDTKGAFFVIRGARYVILEDMVLEGGGGNFRTKDPGPGTFPVSVSDSTGVRLRNIEFSKWGRVGKPDYTRRGSAYDEKTRREINMDAAVLISRGAAEVTVERCYFHDPVFKSCSWYYCHPAGNEGIVMDTPDHSTVIRWCDFVGSDLHRFNDCVEGWQNFRENGGFNRDADVYGNFMVYANDDCIEIDGGQQNVRVFGNRFESALCGVSVQGCCAGPSYVFENLFSGLGEEFGLSGQHIKTSGVDPYKFGPYVLIANNTFWGDGCLKVNPKPLRFDLRNNLFGAGARFCGLAEDFSRTSRFAANTAVLTDAARTGVDKAEAVDFADAVRGRFELASPVPGEAIANFAEGAPARGASVSSGTVNLPLRPLPFALDAGRIVANVAKGRATPEADVVTMRWTGPARGGKVAWRIRKNDVFDWLDVTPASGAIGPGESVALTVRYRPERMRDRRFYRGAFLVRTADGLSRVCSVVAETDFVPPFRAHRPGDRAIYVDAFRPSAGKPKVVEDARGQDGRAVSLGGALEYSFEVPEGGRYFIMLHAAVDAKRQSPLDASRTLHYEAAVDGEPLQKSSPAGLRDYLTWSQVMPGKKQGDRNAWWDFAAGRHTLAIKGGWGVFDGIVVTSSPEGFEPR